MRMASAPRGFAAIYLITEGLQIGPDCNLHSRLQYDINIHEMLNKSILPAEAKISSLAALRAVSDTCRHRILTLLIREPLTPSEVATRLKIARTRVYYHLDLLKEHGFIRVVGKRPVAAMIERTYRACARRFKVDRQMLAAGSSESELNDAQAQLLERAADDLRVSSSSSDVLVTRAFMRLSTARASELRSEIVALVDKYADSSSDFGDSFEMAFALFASKGDAA
jgi:DNA-binding transcriptional ArsR family regulator